MDFISLVLGFVVGSIVVFAIIYAIDMYRFKKRNR